jgi:hypothetical protein
VERGGGRGGLRVGGGEGGEVGGGAAREHERLEPLPGADVEVARPCVAHVAGGGGGLHGAEAPTLVLGTLKTLLGLSFRGAGELQAAEHRSLRLKMTQNVGPTRQGGVRDNQGQNCLFT